MFKFTVEVGTLPVAVITAVDEVMLDGFVEGHLDDGKQFRNELVESKHWDGVAPLTKRLSTPDESLDFDATFMTDMDDGKATVADEEYHVLWLVPVSTTLSAGERRRKAYADVDAYARAKTVTRQPT
jgi:hypothetical protein